MPWIGLSADALEQSTRLGESKADAITVSMHHESKAVVFDLVNPIRTDRHLGAARRNSGLELQLHAAEIYTPKRYFECARSPCAGAGNSGEVFRS